MSYTNLKQVYSRVKKLMDTGAADTFRFATISMEFNGVDEDISFRPESLEDFKAKTVTAYPGRTVTGFEIILAGSNDDEHLTLAWEPPEEEEEETEADEDDED